MSHYTAKGSEELDTKIDTDLNRIASTVSPYAKTGILLGSYGRGEGTPFINPDGSQAPFNDYDLVVIVEKQTDKIRKNLAALEKKLSHELNIPVDLCPYRKNTLFQSEFSLLNYEMKYGHRIIWGDENILDALPDYDHKAIPLSEGSRLLLNRGKLLLDIKRRLSNPEPLNEEERIRFIKFINKVALAFGDAALLVAGQYDISYVIKKARIQHIGECPERDAVISGYLKAIELKDWGNFQPLMNDDIEMAFNTISDLFLRFMPWYRTQYLIRECSIPKALALNLKWNRHFNMQHPRIQLYDAITALLQDKPSISHQRFYQLQQRFS